MTRFPPGWDAKRVQRVMTHYEDQSADGAAAEDDAAFKSPGQTVMVVPSKLAPAIRALIAKHQ